MEFNMESISQTNEIRMIERMKTNKLGLKIVVAKNKISEKYFAVVIEVNPNGMCYKEIEPGDILLSINGIDIDNFQTLNNFNLMDSGKTGNVQRIQLKIHKKGAFDIAGLFSACLNSPCTESCKLMGLNNSQIHLTKQNTENLNEKRKESLISLDSVKTVSEKSINFKLHTNGRHPKLKDVSQLSLEDSSQSSSLLSNQLLKGMPKYKFHQKAVPMKKKENEQKSYRTTLKPKKNFQSHIIQPPQPLFIKRKNNQISETKELSNLKESKSLNNISLISGESTLNHHSNSIPLLSDSSDDISDNENVYIPKIRPSKDISLNEKFFIEGSGNLRNSKGLSKSTDLLVTKPEFELLRNEENISVLWTRGFTTDEDSKILK